MAALGGKAATDRRQGSPNAKASDGSAEDSCAKDSSAKDSGDKDSGAEDSSAGTGEHERIARCIARARAGGTSRRA